MSTLDRVLCTIKSNKKVIKMKKVNLADVDNSLNSLTTTYAGEFAGQYISAALLSGNTLAQIGIKAKRKITRGY
jgi:hypothetical protein